MKIPELNRTRPAGVAKTWKDPTGATYQFSAAWHYRDTSGEPLGVVARFDGDSGKQVIPYFASNGKGGWKAGGPARRVLYGAERLNGHKVLAVVVEGEKAAAALHSLDLVAVSAQGGAGKAKGGAWDALLGVPMVVFCPDNDAPGEKYCREAAAALAAAATPDSPLPELQLLRLPGLQMKGDVCDWLAERLPDWNQLDPVPADKRELLRHEFLVLVDSAPPVPADWLKPVEPKPARPEKEPDGPIGNRYVELPNGSGIMWVFEKNGEIQEQQLCNFNARIVEELVLDNGTDDKPYAMRVVGCHNGRALSPVDLSWESFTAMAWPSKAWHSGCVIEPGAGIKDALRAAIQTISNRDEPVSRRAVFTHTGWREVQGQWVYLHAGGALGKDGPVAGIETDLAGLTRYCLPDPSKTAVERLEAAQASSGYLTLADLSITLPVLACAFLAPFSQALKVDLMVWIEAPSQSQKSSIAAVALAHYGATIDRTSLTANWTGTANAIEGILFTLADCLAVIDDYAPQSSTVEQHKLDATAGRVIRGAGNLQGRIRLKADLTRQVEKYPRGLTIGTGEQWPTGESLNARLFGVTLKRGDVDLDRLTTMQQAAAAGLLARCMADFIADVAGRRDEVIADSKKHWETFRDKARRAGLTGRAPEQVAYLLVGAMLAANHYRAAGVAVDTSQWPETLFALARRQVAHVLESQPADRFRNALQELLAAGAAHLAAVNDAGDGNPMEIQRGRLIGWQSAVKGEIYLLAAPVLELVNEALRKGDTALNIKPAALWRQCQQRGWLLPGNTTTTGIESSRTVKISGRATRVLVFDLAKMLGE